MKRVEGKEHLRSVLEPGKTGRWYPHGEALSAIPKHIPEAALLRQHLVPEPGRVLVAGDYSAFEPRLLAHQSDEQVLVAGCQPGHDVYTDLIPLLQVPTRDIAKSALLALLNGNSAKSFAASLPLPLPEGHRIFGALEKALPKAIEFRAKVQKDDTLTAKSLYGWRRVRGDETPSEWARRAFNLRMQGTAADLLRKLLRDLASSMPADTRLVHQEFDAVILSCPAQMGPQMEGWLRGKMEAVASLSVPLVAKTKHGATLAAVS
jgi:DNA polymerase I-like protein with 3'-5' exonuclease and polymerase domains